MNCEVKGCGEKATVTVRVIKRSVSYAIIPSATGKSFQFCATHGFDVEADIMKSLRN